MPHTSEPLCCNVYISYGNCDMILARHVHAIHVSCCVPSQIHLSRLVDYIFGRGSPSRPVRGPFIVFCSSGQN
jgi:hypothetical protein